MEIKALDIVIGWILGVLFSLVAIYLLFYSPVAAFIIAIVALLLLPPARAFVFHKTKKRFPVKEKITTIISLILLSTIFIGQAHYMRCREIEAAKLREKAEKKRAIEERNIKYFNENKSAILSTIKNALKKRNYQEAISISAKYLPSKDPSLIKINKAAKASLKEAKAKKIIAKLKTIPRKEYRKNMQLYKQLTLMYPNNTLYKKKFNYYYAEIIKEKEKRAAEIARQGRIKSQFSSWDGSHRNLERLIKRGMNDPDSYKHVETVYWDRGKYLIVKTTFRGKNVFGGVVTNWVEAKVDLNGNIIQIIGTGP